jgi:hypothetical protein
MNRNSWEVRHRNSRLLRRRFERRKERILWNRWFGNWYPQAPGWRNSPFATIEVLESEPSIAERQLYRGKR